MSGLFVTPFLTNQNNNNDKNHQQISSTEYNIDRNNRNYGNDEISMMYSPTTNRPTNDRYGTQDQNVRLNDVDNFDDDDENNDDTFYSEHSLQQRHNQQQPLVQRRQQHQQRGDIDNNEISHNNHSNYSYGTTTTVLQQSNSSSSSPPPIVVPPPLHHQNATIAYTNPLPYRPQPPPGGNNNNQQQRRRYNGNNNNRSMSQTDRYIRWAMKMILVSPIVVVVVWCLAAVWFTTKHHKNIHRRNQQQQLQQQQAMTPMSGIEQQSMPEPLIAIPQQQLENSIPMMESTGSSNVKQGNKKSQQQQQQSSQKQSRFRQARDWMSNRMVVPTFRRSGTTNSDGGSVVVPPGQRSTGGIRNSGIALMAEEEYPYQVAQGEEVPPPLWTSTTNGIVPASPLIVQPDWIRTQQQPQQMMGDNSQANQVMYRQSSPRNVAYDSPQGQQQILQKQMVQGGGVVYYNYPVDGQEQQVLPQPQPLVGDVQGQLYPIQQQSQDMSLPRGGHHSKDAYYHSLQNLSLEQQPKQQQQQARTWSGMVPQFIRNRLPASSSSINQVPQQQQYPQQQQQQQYPQQQQQQQGLGSSAVYYNFPLEQQQQQLQEQPYYQVQAPQQQIQQTNQYAPMVLNQEPPQQQQQYFYDFPQQQQQQQFDQDSTMLVALPQQQQQGQQQEQYYNVLQQQQSPEQWVDPMLASSQGRLTPAKHRSMQEEESVEPPRALDHGLLGQAMKEHHTNLREEKGGMVKGNVRYYFYDPRTVEDSSGAIRVPSIVYDAQGKVIKTKTLSDTGKQIYMEPPRRGSSSSSSYYYNSSGYNYTNVTIANTTNTTLYNTTSSNTTNYTIYNFSHVHPNVVHTPVYGMISMSSVVSSMNNFSNKLPEWGDSTSGDSSIIIGTVGVMALLVGALTARRMRSGRQRSLLSICIENESLEDDIAYDAAYTVPASNWTFKNHFYQTFPYRGGNNNDINNNNPLWKGDLEKFDV